MYQIVAFVAETPFPEIFLGMKIYQVPILYFSTNLTLILFFFD